MSSIPPLEAMESINDGTATVTRRVEFYENDGATRWYPAGDDEPANRLIDGSISIDYGTDERRKCEMSLDNRDRKIMPDPVVGLWYDKIIKVYRGVRFPVGIRQPRIAIIESVGGEEGAYTSIQPWLASKGFNQITVMTDVVLAADLYEYDVVVAYSGTGITTRSDLLKSLYDLGHAVVTLGSHNTSAHIPLYTAGSNVSSAYGVILPPLDGPLNYLIPPAGSTTTDTVSSGWLPTAVTPGTFIAELNFSNQDRIAIALGVNDTGGHWADVHLPSANPPYIQLLLKEAIDWALNRRYAETDEWEACVGVFMIDSISRGRTSLDRINVSCRDLTKRLMQSKFTKATAYAAGTSIGTILGALILNGGIPFRTLAVGSETLSTPVSWTPGQSRWEAIKQICQTYRYEAYVDPGGMFNIRPFIDPTLGPISVTFQTGENGNISTIDRSINDSNLYNHVVVYGVQGDDAAALPAFGEARNNEPSSPTRIERLGDRLADPIETVLATTDTAANLIALDFLRVAALETYELSFNAITYPWLEAGEIALILDPDGLPGESQRYLMTSISFPFGPGAMSISGRRITIVGDTTMGPEVEASHPAGVLGHVTKTSIEIGRV